MFVLTLFVNATLSVNSVMVINYVTKCLIKEYSQSLQLKTQDKAPTPAPKMFVVPAPLSKCIF